MIRLHVLAIPHTISTKEYTVCAFTQKVINFCKMFKEQGMHVIHYGHEHSDVICDEHVTVVDDKLFKQVYGHHDWKKYGLSFDQNDLVYQTFNTNCIQEIAKRKQSNDIVLCFFGNAQKLICDAHPDLLICEPSIGYDSQFAPYKVYESYACMHGHQGAHAISEAKYKFYDAVIPSALDMSEFEYREQKDDYFFMMGRLVWAKGVAIAVQTTAKLGIKLVLAGTTYGPRDCGLETDEWPPHVEFVGYADVQKRKQLMAGAKALFCPTIYNEPFGYVAIEAMLSGTPVICTDNGAFTETVQHGLTGYRCRTFEQFVWAARNIHNIKPQDCRAWASANYNFDKVGKMYKEYFTSLINLKSIHGWYTGNDERTELNWLTKTIPSQPKSFNEILKQYNRIKNGKIHFLQIGAMDGVKHDDLYEYVMSNDWTGVLVEPLPDMFEKLVKNYELKDGLEFENSAISDSFGVVDIWRIPPEKLSEVPEWADGCSTLVPQDYITDLVSHLVPQSVQSITIKDLYEKYNNRFDYVQIDTEGYDYNIFLQLIQHELVADLFKIEIAHITYTKAVWMRSILEEKGYKTFIDNYDLIAYRF